MMTRNISAQKESSNFPSLTSCNTSLLHNPKPHTPHSALVYLLLTHQQKVKEREQGLLLFMSLDNLFSSSWKDMMVENAVKYVKVIKWRRNDDERNTKKTTKK